MPKIVGQGFTGGGKMGQRWSPNDDVFMYVGRNLEGGAEVWFEVSGSQPVVYRRKAGEILEPEVEGIVTTMAEVFKADVQHLVRLRNQDSPSVRDTDQARV